VYKAWCLGTNGGFDADGILVGGVLRRLAEGEDDDSSRAHIDLTVIAPGAPSTKGGELSNSEVSTMWANSTSAPKMRLTEY